MKKIEIVDCTLRDGGWVNSFRFGTALMQKILDTAERAGLDFVELGYLDTRKKYEIGCSTYDSLQQMEENFGDVNPSHTCRRIVMIDYGAFQADQLPDFDAQHLIDGIRLCFHKKDADRALSEAERIAAKGYAIYIQPMVTTRYTDEEFQALIEQMQDRLPSVSGIYIVDSFGILERKGIEERILLADRELNRQIRLGLHAHNNRNLAFSNAAAAVELDMERDLMIDGTLAGIGKGSGNVAIEQLAGYLDESKLAEYNAEMLEELAKKAILPLKEQFSWGYSEEYELSARYRVTPTYAKRMKAKGHSIAEIEQMLREIPDAKKDSFDRSFLSAYLERMGDKVQG